MPGKDDQAEAVALHSRIVGFARIYETVTQAAEEVQLSESDIGTPTDTTVANDEFLPILSINATFMVNSIPTAQILIPVGKPADSDSDEGSLRARELSTRLKQFKNIEVFLQIEGEFSPGSSWPEAPFRVFNGYVTGTGLTRTGSGLSLVVHATHWLLDMDASMALTDSLVAGAPVGLLLPSIAHNFQSIGIPPGDAVFKNVDQNLWIDALKPKFVEICNEGSILTTIQCGTDVLLAAQAGRATNNTALRRLESGSSGVFDAADVVDVPKLKFGTDLVLASKGAITQAALGTLYNGSLGSATLWDKLMELAQTFLFTVIPTVDSCVCAPLSACLSGDDPPRHVTIKASEYHMFSPSEPVFRIWRGVSLHGNFTSDFNSLPPDQSGGNPGTKILLSNGCYLAEEDTALPQEFRDRAARGALQFTEAPSWIQDFSLSAQLNAIRSLRGGGGGAAFLGINNRMADAEEGPQADAGNPPAVQPADPGPTDADLRPQLGGEYAKWWYWTRQFLPRTGELTGKLRFDIAPGSIVRIEDIDGKLYDDPAEFGYMYALVTGVRFQVDAANASASTSVTLSHIRRESEREYGTDKHPLYADRWVGTVLQNLEIDGVPQPKSHELNP